MTEQEYIDVTNLVKIRAAKVLLHDTLPQGVKAEGDLEQAMAALRRWEARLNDKVNTADGEVNGK